MKTALIWMSGFCVALSMAGLFGVPPHPPAFHYAGLAMAALALYIARQY